MSRLSIRTIEALEPRETDYLVFDEDTPGFGVRVMASGKKSYFVQYRSGGRTRRITFSRYGVLTPDEARKRARDLLGQVAKGDNPAQVRSDHRRSPTMAAICDRFYTEHVLERCKSSTQKEYKRVLEQFVKKELGTYKVGDVTRADIAALQHKYRHIPYQANRTLGVLSKIFNLTEVWGLRPDGSNPCRHVPKNQERKRERFLSAEEITRLGTVLNDRELNNVESPFVIAAIRLLILTGCRLSEIQLLKWDYVKPGFLELPDSKTGPRRIPLPPAAQAVIEALPVVLGNPYVIAGKEEEQYLTDLQRPWRRIRKAAGLEAVRIHDLRHTYASNAIAAGIELTMVSKLLGHTQIHTTMRYVHLADDPVRAAAAKVAGALDAALGHISGEVSPPRPNLRIVK